MRRNVRTECVTPSAAGDHAYLDLTYDSLDDSPLRSIVYATVYR
jgi:hypothetical protein